VHNVPLYSIETMEHGNFPVECPTVRKDIEIRDHGP
jgi:hypothetical protein